MAGLLAGRINRLHCRNYRQSPGGAYPGSIDFVFRGQVIMGKGECEWRHSMGLATMADQSLLLSAGTCRTLGWTAIDYFGGPSRIYFFGFDTYRRSSEFAIAGLIPNSRRGIV